MSIPSARDRHVRLLPLAAAGLLALGCASDTESPTGPGAPTAAVTATATLVFRQISAGDRHTCGVTTDNRAYCWGLDSTGQLGDGGTANRGRPTLVAGGLRYIEVYAGGNHTCGITTTNRAYCWGANGSGQLGDGTTTERHQPVAVANGSFVQIRAGYRHTCAVNASNVAFCWGDNTWGQLGDNSKTRRLKPVRLAGDRPLPATHGRCHSLLRHRDRQSWVLLGQEWLRRARRRHRGDAIEADCRRGWAQLAPDLGGQQPPRQADPIVHLRGHHRQARVLLGRQRHRPAGRREPFRQPGSGGGERRPHLRRHHGGVGARVRHHDQ